MKRPPKRTVTTGKAGTPPDRMPDIARSGLSSTTRGIDFRAKLIIRFSKTLVFPSSLAYDDSKIPWRIWPKAWSGGWVRVVRLAMAQPKPERDRLLALIAHRVQTAIPGIERTPGVCGGDPCIAG